MTKHTPGPWAEGDYSEIVSEITQVYGGNEMGTLVAQVFGEGREGANANARLIAAAPEMYEAIKNVADELLNHVEEDGLESSLDWCHDTLVEALQKVEGEE